MADAGRDDGDAARGAGGCERAGRGRGGQDPGGGARRRAHLDGSRAAHRHQLDAGALERLRHPRALQGVVLHPGAGAGHRVEDVARRPHLHLHPAEEREVPRRHPVRRGRGQVHLRPAARPQAPPGRDRALPVRLVLLRGDQGGDRRRSGDGALHAEAAVLAAAQQSHPQHRAHREPGRGEEVRQGVREPPGRHRPVQVRLVGQERPDRAGGERGLLGRAAEARAHRVPAPGGGADPRDRAALGRRRLHRGRAARQRGAGPEGRQARVLRAARTPRRSPSTTCASGARSTTR